MIELRPATIDDLGLLRRWDEQPHVIAATGGDDWGWDEELLRHRDWREQLIAELDGRPIGYLEIIDPAREDTHYWGDVPPDLRAIDIWIGEADDLSRGYGTEMMRLALERCFSDPAVTAVLIDPLASNTRAHRFYQRLGFVFVERRHFGGDDCFVYRLERRTFARDAELREWWPDLGTVVAELRGAGRSAVADLLIEGVRAGSSSGEILGGVGVVMRGNRGLRAELSASGAAAWDAVLADVHRAYPVRRLADRLSRLRRRSR